MTANVSACFHLRRYGRSGVRAPAAAPGGDQAGRSADGRPEARQSDPEEQGVPRRARRYCRQTAQIRPDAGEHRQLMGGDVRPVFPSFRAQFTRQHVRTRSVPFYCGIETENLRSFYLDLM